mmetsp:Transcript_2402/g.5464  ORF Transcript_2402/g.5464 Transcript_2402/m.5464 type:complete len:100 (-) Transcript_2402:13-312(-)
MRRRRRKALVAAAMTALKTVATISHKMKNLPMSRPPMLCQYQWKLMEQTVVLGRAPSLIRGEHIGTFGTYGASRYKTGSRNSYMKDKDKDSLTGRVGCR